MAQLTATVGKNMKRLREAAGRRQEDIAVAARQFGFAWSRSTVAMLEAGKYELRAREFLALPRILHQAEVGDVTLLSLAGEAEADIGLSGQLVIAPAEVAKLLGRGARASKVDYKVPLGGGLTLHLGADADASEADEKAARNLGVDIRAWMAVARSLWGRNLAEERDARVAATAPPGAANRTLQALRAHETRALLVEIRPEIDRRGLSPAQMNRNEES